MGGEYNSPFFISFMRLSSYVKIYPCPDDPGKILLYSTRRGAAILVSESILVSINEGSLSHANRETLARLGFLVPDTEAEKMELRDAFAEVNRLGIKFSAQVVLNLDCNLACTYCYEGGMKGRNYMSPETATLLAELAEKESIAHGRGVELSFYGGEPLMSLDLIYSLSERLQMAATAKGTTYSFNMVTNGTLLNGAMVEKLLPLGFTGAKVTLDGPRENHDRFRPFVSGKGSFDLIVANVKQVCGLTDIQVGGNYTRDNYLEFPRLLDFLLDEGITPERISLVKFDPVTKSGGEFPLPEFNEGCASTDEPWLMEAGLFLREEILKRGFHTPRVGPSACMIENPNDLVVNWDGALFKCPAFLGWKNMSIGNLDSGISDYTESHNMDVWKKEECLDCTYLPLCFGGCRFLKLLRDGRIDDVDCRRGYFDRTLEACVRLDLKYQPKRSLK
jgi:uncharacterized protein